MNSGNFKTLSISFIIACIGSAIFMSACSKSSENLVDDPVATVYDTIQLPPPQMAEIAQRGEAFVDWPEDYPGCSALGIPARGFVRGTVSEKGEMLGWAHVSGDSTRSWLKVTVQFFSNTCFGYYYLSFQEITFDQIGLELTADRSVYGGYKCNNPDYENLALPMSSRDSIAISTSIYNHDSPVKDYIADTTEGYRPRLIIDHYFPEEGVLKGRFAGSFVQDPSCTFETELYPPRVQIDEAVWEAKLRL